MGKLTPGHMPNTTLSSALRTCAATAGDEVALVSPDGQELTYREWDRRADLVAAALLERVGPGATVIARLGDRSDALCAVALFGAIRSGCFVLPMAGRFDADDVARAAAGHDVDVVLVDRDTQQPLRSHLDAHTLVVDEAMSSTGPSRPDRAAAPAGGATVFTAGTTGPPAAVRWTHSDLLTWLTGWTGVPQRRPHLNDFPLDTSDALGRLVRTLLRYPGMRSPAHEPGVLLRNLVQHGPSDVLLTAASGRAVLDHHLAELPRQVVESVLSIYLAFDFSGPDVVHRFRAAFQRAAVTNVYCVAEAGRGQIWQTLPPGTDGGSAGAQWAGPDGTSLVGSPVFGTQLKITGQDSDRLGPGVMGRIWLRPGLPSSLRYCTGDERPGVFADGWVRTDDVGLLDDSGCLHLAGRTTDVLAVPGRRLTAHQVQAVIAAYPELQDAAVIGVAGARQEFVAAVVPNVTDRPAPAAAVSVRQRLTDRFGPAAGSVRVVPVMRVPRNSFGKTIRHQLLHEVQQPAVPWEAGTR